MPAQSCQSCFRPCTKARNTGTSKLYCRACLLHVTCITILTLQCAGFCVTHHSVCYYYILYLFYIYFINILFSIMVFSLSVTIRIVFLRVVFSFYYHGRPRSWKLSGYRLKGSFQTQFSFCNNYCVSVFRRQLLFLGV